MKVKKVIESAYLQKNKEKNY